MKRKIIALLLTAGIAVTSMAGCGDSGSFSSKEQSSHESSTNSAASQLEEASNAVDSTPESTLENEIPQSEDSEDVESQVSEVSDEKIVSGSYTLPCGMKIQFFDSVRNDVTGHWRRSATSDSYAPADYALEYYQEMFSSDDEVHSIWNATLGTNTKITVASGILFVDTLKYVKGEEHDAKIMFSGEVLDSKMIDIESGEEINE